MSITAVPRNNLLRCSVATIYLFCMVGCQQPFANVGSLSLPNSGRVPAPATGSYQVPASYSPRQPSPMQTGVRTTLSSATATTPSDRFATNDQGWRAVNPGAIQDESNVASASYTMSSSDSVGQTSGALSNAARPEYRRVGNDGRRVQSGPIPMNDLTDKTPGSSSQISREVADFGTTQMADPSQDETSSANLSWRNPNNL